jgi:hypothetical protein
VTDSRHQPLGLSSGVEKRTPRTFGRFAPGTTCLSLRACWQGENGELRLRNFLVRENIRGQLPPQKSSFAFFACESKIAPQEYFIVSKLTNSTAIFLFARSTRQK